MKKENVLKSVKSTMRIILSLFLILSVSVGITSCGEDPVEPGGASIISFTVEAVSAAIDETAKTVTAELLAGTDITALAPEILISDGASISPASGETVDFTSPVTYTVTDTSGTITNEYTAMITSAELRKLAFIGNAAENTQAAWDATAGTDYDLKDDQTAAEWFESEMASSTNELTYLSFQDVIGGSDLSEYHTIWIQYDGGTWGGVVASFPNNGEGNHCLLGENGVTWDVTCDNDIQSFVTAIKDYYEGGGNLLLGNYAGAIVDEIGVVSSPDYAPNNSWGGLTVDDNATSSEWMVRWAGETTSPLFADIVVGSNNDIPAPAFVMIEAGGEKKNRSNQYNLNWGPWAPNGDTDPLADRRSSFIELTGAQILIENGGLNEPQMVMWEASDAKGAVIAILGGTYDWYIGETLTNADRNMKTLTKNCLNFLTDLALEK